MPNINVALLTFGMKFQAVEKFTNYNGSNFEPALEAMVSNGVDNLANVPFNNSKMTCDGVTGNGNSANKLAGYKIIAYQRLAK